MEIKTYLIVGRPGSGKGTQAMMLAELLRADIYSTGAETRKAAQADTPAGRKFKGITERGDLMPDWFIKNVFVNLMLGFSPEKTVILDGFCRMESEAMLFEEVADFVERPYVVLYVDISEEEARKRLAGRRGAEGRKDDVEESVERRFSEFATHTEKSLTFFRSQNRVIDIDGTGTPEEVFARMKSAVENL